MLYIRIRYISTAKLRGNEFLKCILRTTRRKFLNINGRFVARICLSIAWKCICFHITWSRQILLGSHISDSKATATIDTKCTIFMVASKLDHPHTVYLHVVWARDYSFGTSIGHNTTFPTSIAVVVTTNMLIALHPADPVFGNTRVNSMVIVYEYRYVSYLISFVVLTLLVLEETRLKLSVPYVMAKALLHIWVNHKYVSNTSHPLTNQSHKVDPSRYLYKMTLYTYESPWYMHDLQWMSWPHTYTFVGGVLPLGS